MENLTIFFAYPSAPQTIGETITAAAQNGERYLVGYKISTWQQSEIAGRFIAEEVINKIAASSCLAADITELNFNVTYEVGYAIGAQRRVILTRNRSLKDDARLRAELGVFDTLGYRQYENSQELLDIVKSVSDVTPLVFDSSAINTTAPVYVLEPKFKTDQATRIISRVKRARLFYRSFDPSEQPRLSAHDAIRNVAQSAGVLLQLTRDHNADANLNNLRAAFLAGLAHGMGKVTVILQDGDEPVPIDYRDLVVAYTHPDQIDEAIADFAVRVVEALQAGTPSKVKGPRSFLAGLTLGASSAENEFRDLGEYYLPTAQFLRAARGDARLVVGRKGSGKTALFSQVRDQVRAKRTNIVLDLKPEGYKLRKFNELVGDLLTGGTREHTVMAFWEYLLLLEICYKILEKDEIPHTRNHNLYDPYRRLAETYQSDEYISEGDFSERMTILLERITHDYAAKHGESSGTVLSQAQVTELIYRHDLVKLRDELQAYMSYKDELWILIDNLDKGWPTHGVAEEDLVIIRALLEATRKLERDFQRVGQNCNTIVFLRNDVYELLVGETPDRGKESKVVLDWTDPDLLREVLRRRLVFNNLEDASFEEVWPQICISHIDGQESSQFLIERCLMRPRCLIDLVDHCRAHAVNLQRDQIGRDDLEQGLSTFSSDLLVDIGYEIRDVVPDSDEILYAFLGVEKELSVLDFEIVLAEASIDEDSLEKVTDILLWYGFLGVQIGFDDARYINSVNYDLKRLKGLMAKAGRQHLRYCINPAFWSALEVH